MITTPPFDPSPELAADLRKARRLEIGTVIYLLCTAALFYVVMGSSQAMKTGFFDDLISTVPALAFLVAVRLTRIAPSRRFPFGLVGAEGIGALTASLALAIVGLLLLAENVSKVLGGERTTIGGVEILGHTIWGGWPMIAAAAIVSVPSVFLGRAKLKLAPRISSKVLFADADMMKADWMTAIATVAGVAGVGLGFWWADPLAAILVSLDILHDGARNTGLAVMDLMERQPEKVDRTGMEPLPWAMRDRLRALPWVETADVRVRDVGHAFFGEGWIVPRAHTPDLPARVSEAIDQAKALDWRLHDVTLTLCERLPERTES